MFWLARAFSKTLPQTSVLLTDKKKVLDFFKRYSHFATNNRDLPLKFTLNIQPDPFISNSEYIELIFCLNSSKNPVSDLIPELLTRLKQNKIITLEAYSNLLSLAKQKIINMDSELEKMIFETFFKTLKEIRITDFVVIADLLNSKILKTDDGQIYAEIEKMTLSNIKKMNTSQILTVLRAFNAIIHKFPTDIHVKFEEKLANDIKVLNWETIGYILSVYAGTPRTHHFVTLAKAVREKILEEPSLFFKTEYPFFYLVLHFYSKFRGFNDINELIIKYIPEVTKKMIEYQNFIGIFFLSILRKPPSPDYKKYIIREIIKNAGFIEEFKKKKMIIAMANDPDTEFWDNVHKLGVYWNKSETVFVKKEEAILTQYNLIRD